MTPQNTELVVFDGPDPECENCNGRGCMACVFREMHDECIDDCPTCCGGNPALAVLSGFKLLDTYDPAVVYQLDVVKPLVDVVRAAMRWDATELPAVRELMMAWDGSGDENVNARARLFKTIDALPAHIRELIERGEEGDGQ